MSSCEKGMSHICRKPEIGKRGNCKFHLYSSLRPGSHNLPSLLLSITRCCVDASYARWPMLQNMAAMSLLLLPQKSDSSSMEAFCHYLTAPSLSLWSAVSFTEPVMRDILYFYYPKQGKLTFLALECNFKNCISILFQICL